MGRDYARKRQSKLVLGGGLCRTTLKSIAIERRLLVDDVVDRQHAVVAAAPAIVLPNSCGASLVADPWKRNVIRVYLGNLRRGRLPSRYMRTIRRVPVSSLLSFPV